ncbi:MAG: hypothetical protein HY063_00440 [Bacteroidetes bacterium]|nr:hypothetical protein [Bacteroidota bacterium]
MSILNQYVNYFPRAVANMGTPDYYGSKILLSDVLIKMQTDPRHLQLNKTLRAFTNAEEQKEFKNTEIPCFTVSAYFEKNGRGSRGASDEIYRTNLIVIEFDAIDPTVDLKLFKQKVKKEPYAAYVGDSCRGKGFFAIIHVSDPYRHLEYFEFFRQWAAKNKCETAFDENTKNINRLRYVAPDPDHAINYHTIPLTLRKIKNKKAFTKSTSGKISRNNSFEIANHILAKKGNIFSDGAKHNYIFNLCCWLNKMGVPQTEAEQFINTNLLALSEIKSNCIWSPYKNYIHEFGTFDFDHNTGYTQAASVPTQEFSYEKILFLKNTAPRNECFQNLAEGKTGVLKFSIRITVPFTYALIEADDLQPSHLPSGERNPKHYISAAQPKERSDLASLWAQNCIANNPNFSELSECPHPYSGAPVVNIRTETIQGTSRGNGIKNHYRIGKVKYKFDLLNDVEKYGFIKEQIENMRSPVLVRLLKVDDNTAIKLGQYVFKDLETGGKQRIDPIATSRKISLSDKSKLTSILFFADDYQTTKETIRGNASVVAEIIKGYLNSAQHKNTFTKEGKFTSNGIDDVEDVIKHFLFEGGDARLPEIFSNLPSNIQKGLQKAMQYIFSAEKEKSILEETQNAMMIIYDFKNSPIDIFDQWANTIDMFKATAQKDLCTKISLILAEKLLEAKNQSEIKHIYEKYEDLVKKKEATLFDKQTEGLSKKIAILCL